MGTKTSYLDVEFEAKSPSGKTSQWSVWNSENGSYLGIIKWHGPWRKYAFFCTPSLLLEEKCMRKLANIVEEKTREHKEGGHEHT